MIQMASGNLLMAKTEALVNTVNCVGFMGKGIALQFKKAFPDNFRAYEQACRAGRVQPGRMFVFLTGAMFNPKLIINFPTKRHWKGNSRMEDIESGLKALIEEVKERNIRSIAIPPLGCGLGGLKWSNVRSMIEKAFAEVPDVEVMLYPPMGTPDAASMPVNTQKPKMTPARALLIKLMDQYAKLDYRLSLLEIQKLAYFLQESGERLRLNYDAGTYGPYAPNLNKVLEILEGHFIRGYGDTQKPDVLVKLLPGAPAEADDFLQNHEESRQRLDRVGELISGFETPYGMELLASTHWVATHAVSKASDVEAAILQIHQWTDRKRRMFQEKHIRVAWGRLQEEGWIASA
jgi:O-acetyl-ADP-ribose deacetylase (regulator of RNase III)